MFTPLRNSTLLCDPASIYLRISRSVFKKKTFFRYGVNFTNAQRAAFTSSFYEQLLRAAFTSADPKSSNKLLNLTGFFVLLGSVRVKVACRTLVKLTTLSVFKDNYFKINLHSYYVLNISIIHDGRQFSAMILTCFNGLMPSKFAIEIKSTCQWSIRFCILRVAVIAWWKIM